MEINLMIDAHVLKEDPETVLANIKKSIINAKIDMQYTSVFVHSEKEHSFLFTPIENAELNKVDISKTLIKIQRGPCCIQKC